MKRFLRITAVFLWGMVSNGLPLAAQAAAPDGIGLKDIIPWGLALAAFLFGLYQYLRRRADKRNEKIAELEGEKQFKKKEQQQVEKTHEELYTDMLREQLGTIDCYGSPDIQNEVVNLDQAFVHLSISHRWPEGRGGGKGCEDDMKRALEPAGGTHSPQEVLKHAFQHYRLLLVTGDPGSGKTTLVKYYAMVCLKKNGESVGQLGLSEGVLPLYFPLREFPGGKERGEFYPLPRALASWAPHTGIEEQQFKTWLLSRDTLVLLDGLDEISDPRCRKKVCRWINEIHGTFKRAHFVITCRETGFRRVDGMDFGLSHARAEIMDFSPDQQAEFLHKWYRAVYLSRQAPPGESREQWEEKQVRLAQQRACEVIDYLGLEANRVLRQLTSVPMMLQILALIWLERGYRPKTRAQLYQMALKYLLGAALNYLLGQRDEARDIDIVLDYENSRRVLQPAALWMQQLGKDEVEKEKLRDYFQPLLGTLPGQPDPGDFCRYLIERTGVLAEYGREHYVFRHKTFREYLAAAQLVKEALKPGRIQVPVKHFKEDWWEETLRFFAGLSDVEVFDGFLDTFFRHEVSGDLNPLQRKLLLQMVNEAPQKPIAALVKNLNREGLDGNRRTYILDCLKAVGSPDAITAIKAAEKQDWSEVEKDRAEDIVEESEPIISVVTETRAAGRPLEKDTPSFRNPFESNVEYIRIPGGTFSYSRAEEKQTVGDFYLCKYPVTNARYRGFIDYISGKETELTEILPPKSFSPLLLEFAGNNAYDGVIAEGFSEYLGKDPFGWKDKLRSGYEDNKKFNGPDQPVVEISWYAARSYCFWLSCLEAADKDKTVLGDIRRLSEIYRLPDEMEWEWAAGGNPGGTVRAYPWPKDKGEPTSELANYEGNVGATTPVGNYPAGATPLGLMDMAGNVWEWMDNYYKNDKKASALCGGSWSNNGFNLRCRARFINHPHHRFFIVGLRPLRPQSSFLIL